MKNLICIVLFLLPLSLQAQQANVDSLVNALGNNNVSKEEKLELYHKICTTYLYYNLEKASEYVQKGLDLAEREKDKVMLSKFNAIYGRLYGTKSSYDTAFVYYEKALDLAVQAKEKKLEAVAYADIGILYARQNNFTSALEYFMKALAIYENIGDKQARVKVMSNISSLYRGMENDERVIYYLEKAKKIAEEINYDEGKMQVYFELGAIYHKLAENEPEKVEFALQYELKANKLSHQLNHKVYQTATAQALAAIYLDYLNDYDKALEHANESLQLAEETGDPKMIIGALSTISNIYLLQKRYRECEGAALEAWRIDSTEIHTGTDLLKNIILSNIALDNKDRASVFFKIYNNYVKTQINQNNREIMADMEAKYEAEKKEIRIMALEKERSLYIGLGIVIIIALILGLWLLFYRHRSVVQKQKIAEQEIKQLKQEKELIAARSALDAEKVEREVIARDLHDGVGAMLSVVKNNMDIMKSYLIVENVETDCFYRALDVLDKSIVELRRVAHHIMPATLIDKGLVIALDDFCRSIPEVEFHFTESDYRFNPEKELILYRCAYELVNNTLRHAGASHIDVHLNMNEKTVYLSVVDNGCGFDPQTVSMGMGINNMRTRLLAFGGRIDIYSDQGKGTEVNIELDV
ncbi:MAG: sensor histidine kinase [Tannerellaceae bacterium]|jgi:signal transduction histidine kinase|nr:sensor histidine kinase [Tannerellaceae bacterium]